MTSTEERALRSANAKLLADRKALERRVADLEEEIKVRCRNYMNIIERMRRGELVTVERYDRSDNGSAPRPENGHTRDRPLGISWQVDLKVDTERAARKDQKEPKESPLRAPPKTMSDRKVRTLPELQFRSEQKRQRQGGEYAAQTESATQKHQEDDGVQTDIARITEPAITITAPVAPPEPSSAAGAEVAELKGTIATLSQDLAKYKSLHDSMVGYRASSQEQLARF